MARTSKPDHFVVDGSNIATEGRSTPSLEQLNDAVLAFMDDREGAIVTVVVDATFGHRIAKKEVKAFDEAVANNELVTPPAGAVGRGDAFVLSIADKAGAGVLSNDSFQEFHGDYDWLFDEGRLIGGKPVPHVGWVFVTRTPVRGPKSRRAVREAKDDDRKESKQQANRRVRAKSGSKSGSKSSSTSASTDETPASEPAAEPAPEKSSASKRRRGRKQSGSKPDGQQSETAGSPSGASKDQVNELMPFLDFVERHPVGTSCSAEVESYASHGAYARSDDVLIYLPLRLLEDPPPRSARSVLDIGESITVVIVGFTPDRRSIDAALPHMAAELVEAASAHEPVPSDEPKPARKRAKKTAKKTPAKKAPAKKAAAKKSAAKKASAKKAPAKKTSAPTTSTAKKSTARKTPAAKKAAAKKAAAKKAPTKKAAAKKAPAKKTAAKKAPAKKAAARKAPAKKAGGRRRSTKQAAGDAAAESS
ncbi:MAG: histone H1-like repetitive region-containing protein [Ilumatobacter sp.]|nr:histone H1-like repetitive region-containing protein [Ilumatobacter sp.]